MGVCAAGGLCAASSAMLLTATVSDGAYTIGSAGAALFLVALLLTCCHCRHHARLATAAGVDGGTESIRAGVFDLAGKPLSFASAVYATNFPAPGWAEQDPADWWAGLGTAVKEAVQKAGVAPTDIGAICIDTTCCSVVALDAAGKVSGVMVLSAGFLEACKLRRQAVCLPTSHDPSLHAPLPVPLKDRNACSCNACSCNATLLC